MRVSTGSLLAVIAPFFTSACSSGGVGASCHTDIDCGTGLYCGGGSCVLSASTLCSMNSDCTNGQSCLAGVCSTGSGTGLSNSGSGSGSASGTASGSGSGTSSGSSSGSSTAYYGSACMQDSDCNPPGWGGFTGNGSPGNSCQNDLNGNLCCAIECPSNGAACPSGSQCNATTNSSGTDQILQCIAATCPTLSSSTTTSSSGTVSSTTSSTSSSGYATTTTSSSGGTTTTTTTSSSTTSGCTSWSSTQANSFYTTNCNYCHGHDWTYTSGCSDSEISSKISGNSMPPGGGLSSSDKSNILQYISCGCPQ
jgi:hypothetical protein